MWKYLILVLLGLSCSPNEPQEVCEWGEPKQIFDTVITSHFKLYSGRSEEHLYFRGKWIEIRQYGCNPAVQEFIFPKKQGTQAVHQLKTNLMDLVVHEKYVGLSFLAEALDSTMLDREVEVQPGFTIEIIDNKEKIFLIVKNKLS